QQLRPGVATRHGRRQKPRFLPPETWRGMEKIAAIFSSERGASIMASEAGSITSATGAAPAARAYPSPLAQFSWVLFDGARSPYNVFINIFVFSAYFSTVVIPDPVRGQTWWSYITSGASVLIAISAPVLGAIADAGGRRKPWLLAS